MNSKKEKNNIVFDLEERTALFGESILKFAKLLSRDQVNNVLIDQIVRSGTSIGANYMEADAAESKKDFRHKISLCKKESKETTLAQDDCKGKSGQRGGLQVALE